MRGRLETDVQVHFPAAHPACAQLRSGIDVHVGVPAVMVSVHLPFVDRHCATVLPVINGGALPPIMVRTSSVVDASNMTLGGSVTAKQPI